MKKKIMLLIILMVSVSCVLTVTIYSMKKAEKVAVNIQGQKVDFAPEPSEKFLTNKEMKQALKARKEKDTLNARLEAGAKFINYKSGLENDSNNVKYQIDDKVIKTCYNIKGKDMNFIWEYSVKDANALLSNSIKQFGLIEIFHGSNIYTYPDWNSDDVKYIDVFWTDDGQSFVANLPKEVVEKDKGFVSEFCNNKKVLFE